MEIVAVESGERLDQVRALFEEYWASFGFTPCFQGFADEVATLPGKYAPPGGRLGLALVDGVAAGCAALRRVDDLRCEGKRLYVRPQFRGTKLGLTLLEWAFAQARSIGYRELLGDTMPEMEQAIRMYERLGFERIEPYMENPTPGAICLRYRL